MFTTLLRFSEQYLTSQGLEVRVSHVLDCGPVWIVTENSCLILVAQRVEICILIHLLTDCIYKIVAFEQVLLKILTLIFTLQPGLA